MLRPSIPYAPTFPCSDLASRMLPLSICSCSASNPNHAQHQIQPMLSLSINCILHHLTGCRTSYEKCRVNCLWSTICWFLITSMDTSQQLQIWVWQLQAIRLRQFVIAIIKYSRYSSIYYTLDINLTVLFTWHSDWVVGFIHVLQSISVYVAC